MVRVFIITLALGAVITLTPAQTTPQPASPQQTTGQTTTGQAAQQPLPPIPPVSSPPVANPVNPISQPLQNPAPPTPGVAPLTLADALRMTRQRNGTVAAENYNVGASNAQMKQAFGSFFPTITPEATYTAVHQTGGGNLGSGISNGTGGGTGSTGGSGGGGARSSGGLGWSADIAAKWQILDSGQREYNYLSTRSAYEAEQQTYLQTLRQTLFNTIQDYFNALRSQQLESVSAAQSERAATILDQTNAQVQVGAAPAKDILQARSDYLNAVVQQLGAKNQTATAVANLKAIIGWDQNTPLPPLQNVSQPTTFQPSITLDQAIAMGLRDRPDLQAERLNIRARHYDYLNAQQQSILQWSLNTAYTATVIPRWGTDRLLNFSVQLPLFDGGVLRERARQVHFEEFALRATLTQRERDVRAQIETDYATLIQNGERAQAAQLAIQAAQQNYQAEVEAQRLGAANATIVTVLTAQVTLVTAESNYIQAVYDYYISENQLLLDTGQALPGQV